MSFGRFNSTNNNNIVPTAGGQQHIIQQDQTMRGGSAGSRGRGRPDEKRQPHGGVKSHKLLDEPSFQNLFVARLPKTLGNDDLLALFQEFNPVSATVMMDVNSGRSKGFGFVTFASVAEGRVAKEHMETRILSIPQDPISTTLIVPHTQTNTEISDFRFTLEIKPSTFNGQRIVVESRYVYFRNFPIQLSDDQFGQIRAFLSAFGTVWDVEIHGGSQGRHESFLPAVLVSFGSKEEAHKAISECHGKILFPHLSSVAVMAKYADMTTVKSLDKQRPWHLRSTIAGGSSGSSAVSTPPTSARGKAHHVGSSPEPPGGLPFPSLNRAPVLVSRAGLMQHQQHRSSLGGSTTTSSVRGGSFSGPQSPLHGQGRSPPVVDFVSAPLVSTVSGSSNISSARGSLRGASSGQSQRSYRNDPYNNSGYVMTTSSSSSSSHSSRISNRSDSSFEQF